MTRIAVVDHGAGNLVSIAQGLVAAGAEVVVAADAEDLAGADGLVLPGVGATGAAMARLTAAGFVEALRSFSGPLLGICVGMQLLFESSEEDGAPCLGLIPGGVRRLADTPRLPHIGWNDVEIHRSDRLFTGIADGTLFYFVHSFAPVPDDPGATVASTDYGRPFTVAVRAGNLAGVQFHPERSGPAGLALLGNFVAECAGSVRTGHAA